MSKNILELIEKVNNSAFGRSISSKVNLDVSNLIKRLEAYTDQDKFAAYYENAENTNLSTTKEFLTNAIPTFQRDNNKWNQEMQIKFVQNLLKGAETSILLFKTEEMQNYQVIDGLQRLTALLAFIDGEFTIFNGYAIEDLEDVLDSFDSRLTIALYDFEDWKAVGQFYIDINNGITHSPEDIQKAIDWFKKEKNIILVKD